MLHGRHRARPRHEITRPCSHRLVAQYLAIRHYRSSPWKTVSGNAVTYHNPGTTTYGVRSFWYESCVELDNQ